MIETISSIISIIGAANTAHDFYKKVSTLIQGDKTEQYLQQMTNQLGNMNVQIERLSDRILYAPNLQSIRDVKQNRQQVVNSLREIRESLEPAQKALGEDILSSAIIWTPEKMRRAIGKNPWEVLLHICPLNLFTTRPTDPNLLPILFEHGKVQYIGWQLRGTLPILFDCEYNELWATFPQSSTSIQSNSKHSLYISTNENKTFSNSYIKELKGEFANRTSSQEDLRQMVRQMFEELNQEIFEGGFDIKNNYEDINCTTLSKPNIVLCFRGMRYDIQSKWDVYTSIVIAVCMTSDKSLKVLSNSTYSELNGHAPIDINFGNLNEARNLLTERLKLIIKQYLNDNILNIMRTTRLS